MSGTEWRDLLVLAESVGGRPHGASFEVMGKARDLADRLGARVLCAWSGSEDEGQALIHRGADELVLLEGGEGEVGPLALKTTCEALLRERRPEMVLFAATPLGQELAGRLGTALGVGVLANCLDLDLDEASRVLLGKRQAYLGAFLEQVRVPRAHPQMATLRPGALRAPYADDGRYGRVSRFALRLAPARRVTSEGRGQARMRAEWRGAERLIVGGALLDDEGFNSLRELAGKLGASWAATRSAAALGLAPEERALRPWDRFPPPRLCIAAGIEDPYEFTLALPTPKHLVLLGEGPLERVAQQVVPGEPGPALRALAEQVR